MASRNETLAALKHTYGARATDSPFEVALYSRDLNPVPGFLVDPLFKTTPDLVLRPANAVEIADILRRAGTAGIPVTPRAGASTVYFDAVPVRRGIVLDLNDLKGIVALDKDALTVTVKAGTTWRELEQYLHARGYAPKAVPSSAPASSVAGWLSMMGYGIGTIKYGPVLSHVREAEVVLPSGEIRRVTPDSDPPLAWFAGAEGTLGIITSLKIEIRRHTPMAHFLLHSRALPELLAALSAIKDAAVVPYNLHFTDEPCVQAMYKQGIAPGGVDGGSLLAVDYEGEAATLAQAKELIQQLVHSDEPLSLLPAAAAAAEWQDRYKSMRLKRSGPSELGGEVFLPVAALADYLGDIRQLARRYRLALCSYGHVASPTRIIIMTMFFADETKVLSYVTDLSLVKKIQDIGYRHGGYPYGVGLWNTPYLPRIFAPQELAERRARKQKLDPAGIMNPGKLYRWPSLLNPAAFTLGMNVLGGVRRWLGGGVRQ